MLRSKQVRLPPEAVRLAEAGESAIALCRIFMEAGVNLTTDQQRAACDLYVRFCRLTNHIEGSLIPKRHLVVHMLQQLPSQGNPRQYANWLDESLNKTLRACCRQLSQATFESALLVNMEEILRAGGRTTITRKRKRPASDPDSLTR